MSADYFAFEAAERVWCDGLSWEVLKNSNLILGLFKLTYF
jgi:hypothetical protein